MCHKHEVVNYLKALLEVTVTWRKRNIQYTQFIARRTRIWNKQEEKCATYPQEAKSLTAEEVVQIRT